ncbi:MAG: SpoIIE family protein phosphatase [Bacteroidales bacterium]
MKHTVKFSLTLLPLILFIHTVLKAAADESSLLLNNAFQETVNNLNAADSFSTLIQYKRQDYYITEIKRIEWSHKGRINIISSRQIDSVSLPHNYAYLKIDFPVLEYNDTIVKNYKYLLIKKKNNLHWTNLGSNPYVILSKLRPGKHTLFVAAYLPEQNISYRQGKLDIYIASQFWLQWYIVLFYIIIFIAMLLLFFRFQTRALRKLTRQYREREKIAQQIMNQKEELATKNKNITDSINYAKRIQSALMPSKKLFHSIFPESFVLHIPKDIVSGDFYWINEVKETIFIAAVDCTGHGVPGAFMSIIGFELFRKLTNVEGIKKPSDILNNLNEDFQDIFKDVENMVLKDGMDIAFCSVNKKTKILEFAGAFNPLYLIRDNSIIEIKGDRNSVGLPVSETEKCIFENHSVQLQKEDIFYIFSDGFADQFGGPEGKKYKYRRFRHLLLALHHLPPERQHDFLYKSIMEWKGDLDQVDDILVLGVKVNF